MSLCDDASLPETFRDLCSFMETSWCGKLADSHSYHPWFITVSLSFSSFPPLTHHLPSSFFPPLSVLLPFFFFSLSLLSPILFPPLFLSFSLPRSGLEQDDIKIFYQYLLSWLFPSHFGTTDHSMTSSVSTYTQSIPPPHTGGPLGTSHSGRYILFSINTRLVVRDKSVTGN